MLILRAGSALPAGFAAHSAHSGLLLLYGLCRCVRGTLSLRDSLLFWRTADCCCCAACRCVRGALPSGIAALSSARESAAV
ncbi:hypothetical protein EJP77_19850 [Paenibacillus zeisoli]|uniref:Uncharacterized protein n=1 Tax=Paenibacillus zeisoli TaxID=2496267 RepID=A0A433X1C2_9BACL|nr:hypothetical protein [Paenibacillus zeisoli]RUT27797.1 hypothetical protein EJP77_19850 [Paenibacillus zeisoli]